MGESDRRPLANTPATNRITRQSNNRLGAVYSALHGFWSARHVAINAGSQAALARQDAYSVILFDDTTSNIVTNNFTSSPDDLLDALLPHQSRGGTNFAAALRAAQTVMEQHFGTQRYD